MIHLPKLLTQSDSLDPQNTQLSGLFMKGTREEETGDKRETFQPSGFH